MALTDWFKNPASNSMLQNTFGNKFFQNQVQPVQSGATNVRPTNLQALKNWQPWRAFMPQNMGGTFFTKPTAGASSALGMGATIGLPALYTGAAMGLQKSLPDELKGEGGIYETAGYDDPMSAGASIPPETDEILRANAIFSGNRPGEETVTDQWTLPQTDWGEVKPTEPQPERGKIDMFLQKFGVPPMTQVSDADRTANKQFMGQQEIGRDPQTGRMIGGDFEGMNPAGESGWGSANFDEMSQNWMDKYGDVEYSQTAIGDMKRRKQARMKQRAAEFATQQQAQQQERIRNERAAASAANRGTQRDPTGGGASGRHMGNISQAQASQVAAANAAAGMGGWGLAYGGRVGYNKGGRVGILSIF